MSQIDVVVDEDGFKILVNFIRIGVILHSAQLANQEAKKLKDTHYPKADLHLIKEAKPKLVG